ncbi:MAG: hypothetical protein GX755_00850 [Syntrophomonadaceae bacterium]|nr:hypothetical protein [Syntrophomonadaceae bacterium]
MVIPTTTVANLGCTVCGCTEVYHLSLFLFSSYQSVGITCNCGTHLLNLGSRNHKRFSLQVYCPYCHQPHLYLLNRRQVWPSRVLSLKCLVNGQVIGLLGPEEEVVASRKAEQNRVTQKKSGDSPTHYFENPTAMDAALSWVRQMVEKQQLECLCEQLDLAIEVFPDKLRLSCERCGAWNDLAVCSDIDYQALSSRKQIQLYHLDRLNDQGGAGGRSSQSRNKRNL